MYRSRPLNYMYTGSTSITRSTFRTGAALRHRQPQPMTIMS